MKLKEGVAMSKMLTVQDLDEDLVERMAAQNARRNATRSDKKMLLNGSSLQHLSVVETKDLGQLSQIVAQDQLYDALYLRNQELHLDRREAEFVKRQYSRLETLRPNRYAERRREMMGRRPGPPRRVPCETGQVDLAVVGVRK